MKVVAIAEVCHEANRALCAGLGDFSQQTWPEAPEWQVQSAITGVEFNLANPDAPASASHDSWLAEKERDGWKFGPVKDAEKKEHPCFVPYEELPKEQQAKDHLFKAIVAALAPLVEGALCSSASRGLNFGQAVEALKAGKRVARVGWNGKGMFVYLVPANAYPPSTEAAKSHFKGELVPYNAYLAIKNVNETVSTWVPSINDTLAEDWEVLDA